MLLEISKICHYFITHGDKISGTVEDSKPRRLHILAVKLNLTFKSSRDLMDNLLKNLLRYAYTWEVGTAQVSKLKEPKIKMKMLKKSILNQTPVLILVFFNILLWTDFHFSEKNLCDNLIWGTKFGDFRKKSPYFSCPINSIPKILSRINMSPKVFTK